MAWLLGLTSCDGATLPTLTPDPLRPTALVAFQTPAPERAWLEFTSAGQPDRRSSTELEPRTDHYFRLAGVEPGSLVWWRAVWGESRHERSRWRAWAVDRFELPDHSRIVTGRGSDDPGYLTLPGRGDTVWIVNGDGEVVWWWRFPDEVVTARLRLRGDRVWASTSDAESDHASFASINLDGTEMIEAPVTHHHDFLLVEDRLVYLRRVLGTGPDGQPWTGDEIVEVEDDQDRVVWSTFDDVSFEVAGDKQVSGGLDWTHCNGIYFDPGEDAYWVSCRHQEAIFVVNRLGQLLRVIGGLQSTLLLEGEGFGRLHVPELRGDLMYVFNNSPGTGHRARAEVYRLDLGQGSYSLSESYEHPGHHPDNHGNVSPAADGGMMVAFGADGLVELVDRDGEVTLAIETRGVLYPDYLPTLSRPLP